MRRKILPILLAACLMLSLAASPAMAVTTFADMPDGAYGEALQKAVDNGLLLGSGDKIMPDASLTRGQMAAIISRAFGTDEKADISAFSDVSADAWYYTSLQTAYQMGVLTGNGSQLWPEKLITREEAFVVMARALKLTPVDNLKYSFLDEENISAWSKNLIYAMVNAGYVNGDGHNLRLKETITRKDFATVFANIIKTYIQTPGVRQTVSAGNVMVNTPGVTLKDLTITGDLIIGEGVGNGDMTLDNVTVTGRVVVRGGGENSIHIKNNSQVGSLLISKTDSGAVRIATEDGCSVEFTYIDDGQDSVILEGSFTSVSVGCSVPVVAQNADIGTVTISSATASVKIDGTSSVANMAITADATGALLEVSAGAKVTKLESSAQNVAISGAGTIAEATVSGDNTSVNTSGTKVTVTEGTSGVSAGGSNINSGNTTVTPTTESSGSSGGGGSSHTGPRDVDSFAELQSAGSSSRVTSINITANLEITENITLNKPVTIADGVTLTVADGADLLVEEADTFINNGTLEINGSADLGASNLTNNGIITLADGTGFGVYMCTLTNEGQFLINTGATLTVDNGGQLVNNGTLTNNGTLYVGIEGAWVYNTNLSAVLTNSGQIILYGFLEGDITDAGGTVENHVATPTNETEFLAAIDDDNMARIYLTEDTEITLNTTTSFTKKVEIEDGKLILNADVTVSGASGYLAVDGDGTETASKVVINEDKTLTVAAASKIALSAQLEVQGSLINNGQIIIDENGVLYLEGGSVTNDTDATLTSKGAIRLFSAAVLTNNGTLQQDGVLLLVDVYEEDGCTPCSIDGTAALLNNQWSGRVAEINNASYLTTVLDGSYTEVNLNDNYETSADLVIPAGTSFTVKEGITLTIAAGTELLAEETEKIVCDGTLLVNGSVVLGATDLDNNGTLTVADSASIGVYMCTLTNNEQLNVNTNGIIEMDRGGQFVNNGTLTNNGTVNVVQNNGGHFTNNGTIIGNEPVMANAPILVVD